MPPQVPPQKPPLKPPKLPSGSADSFSTLPTAHVDHLLKVVYEVEQRLTDRIGEGVSGLRSDVDSLDKRLFQVEKAAAETRELSGVIKELNKQLGSLNDDVRKVLQRDADQEGRLAKLEAIASAAGTEAGHEAGKATGKKWGVLSVVVALVVSATLDWCQKQVQSHQTTSTTQPAKP